MEQNKKYIFRAVIGGKLLTYTGTITKIDDMFITFIDRFGGNISINKENIQSYEEIGQ